MRRDPHDVRKMLGPCESIRAETSLVTPVINNQSIASDHRKIESFTVCRAETDAVAAVLNEHLCVKFEVVLGGGDRKTERSVSQVPQIVVLVADSLVARLFGDAPVHRGRQNSTPVVSQERAVTGRYLPKQANGLRLRAI